MSRLCSSGARVRAPAVPAASPPPPPSPRVPRCRCTPQADKDTYYSRAQTLGDLTRAQQGAYYFVGYYLQQWTRDLREVTIPRERAL